MRTRFIVGLSLLLLVAPLQAWERDVHYDLTFWLARHAGFSDAHAEAIAKADQGLDDSAFTSAVGLMAHIAVSGEEASAIQVQKYHFPSEAAIPSPPEARAVEPNSKAARLEAVNATAATDAANALQRFGQALHPFQDSWSHAGVPDSPLRPGPRINERLSFGHPAGRGGWPRHDADLAHLHPKDVTEMARATYDLMLAFLQNNPRYRDHAATATAGLDGALAAFLLARTKQAKVAWVTKFGKGNLSTDVLTLAGVRKATRHVRTVKRRNADLGSRPAVQVATLGGAAIAVDQEEPPVPGQLVERAHELLRKWFDERNPAAALEFVDVRAVGKQFEGYPPPLGGPEPVHEVNLWCRRFMTMYLLADHARANLLGHCEPRHTGYDYMPESISAACDVPAEIVLEPTDGAAFIPRPNGEYALIVTFDDLPHDAVALVWRRSGNDWRVVQMFGVTG